MNPDNVEFVLVRPARIANIAGAARALANMGFARLAFVEAPAALGTGEGRAAAYGAWEVLDRARRMATLEEAVASCAFVVGASARASTEAIAPRALTEVAEKRCGGGRLAIVFGPERTGLTAAELRRCHAQVRIATSSRQPSLNLAQAVLVIAYELSLAGSLRSPAPAVERVTSGELEGLLEHWRDALIQIGYFDPRSSPRLLAELRRFVARASPSHRELLLLRGIARQVLWAGRRAVPTRDRRSLGGAGDSID